MKPLETRGGKWAKRQPVHSPHRGYVSLFPLMLLCANFVYGTLEGWEDLSTESYQEILDHSYYNVDMLQPSRKRVGCPTFTSFRKMHYPIYVPIL